MGGACSLGGRGFLGGRRLLTRWAGLLPPTSPLPQWSSAGVGVASQQLGVACGGWAWPGAPGACPNPSPPPSAEPGEAEGPPNLHPGALLYWAAQHRRLPTMADALAHGADPGWVNMAEENRTPLLQAVAAVRGGLPGATPPYRVLGAPLNWDPQSPPPPIPFRTPCWPASSCCRTEPASTRATAAGGGRCTTPPCWGTLGASQ